jgi:hypothetical protein
MKKPSRPARRPSAGAVPGRRGLLGGKDLAGRFLIPDGRTHDPSYFFSFRSHNGTFRHVGRIQEEFLQQAKIYSSS